MVNSSIEPRLKSTWLIDGEVKGIMDNSGPASSTGACSLSQGRVSEALVVCHSAGTNKVAFLKSKKRLRRTQILDDKLNYINFQFVKDDMVQMTYNFKCQIVDNSKNTNIYITCFTTSDSRLMLYDKLDCLQKRVIYFDTDSIIYADDRTKHIETGDMVSDMTNELSGKKITNFVSTGLKSYCSKYGENEQKSTIKGFTLNHENSSLLNDDSLSKIVKQEILRTLYLTRDMHRVG